LTIGCENKILKAVSRLGIPIYSQASA